MWGFKPNVEKMHAKRDIQGLIKALSYEKDPLVRQQAAKFLGTLGDKSAIEPLISLLKDKDENVRWKTIEALGRIGDAQAVEPIISILENETGYNIRYYAINALGVLKDSRAVEPLVTVLKDAGSDMCQEAAKALDNIGWKPGEDDTAAAYWKGKKNWEEYAKIIGAPALKLLISLLKSADWDERNKARRAVLLISDSRIVEPLIATFEKNNDSFVRVVAAEALGKIGDFRAVEPLVAALKDSNNSSAVLVEVVQALGKLGDVRAVEPLIALLTNWNTDVCSAAARALGVIGDTPMDESQKAAFMEPAVEPLVALLKSKDTSVRKAAANTLGVIGDTRIVESLRAAFMGSNESDSSYVNETIKKSLIKLGVTADAIEGELANLDRKAQEKRQKELSICPECSSHLRQEKVGHVIGMYCPKCNWVSILCYSCKAGWMKAYPYTIRPGVPQQARLKCDSCFKESDADYGIIGWLRQHQYPGFE